MDNNIEDVNLQHLHDLARRAYYFTSFDPDKRADQIVKDYGEELRNDLKEIRKSQLALLNRKRWTHLFPGTGRSMKSYLLIGCIAIAGWPAAPL